jgi:hypothetical protein
MSMIGCFYALKDQDLEAIIEQPARIKKLWDAPIFQPKPPSLLGKPFGSKTDLAQFKANEIYPAIWDSEPREECLGYIAESLKALRDFVQQTAATNKALIAYLG